MPASSVSVSFPSYGVAEDQPRGIRVIQEEYKHDIAVYMVRASRKSYAYKSGTPVRIDWASGRQAANFCGYVHHIEPSGNDVMVWARGASNAFDNGAQVVFRDRTVASVARELARTMSFDVQAEEHGQVFSSISATGGRVWKTLVESAQEIGYSLYCNNTRLSLHPRLHTVRRFAGEAPVFRSAATGDHSLFSFHPMDGHAAPGKLRANRVIAGTDPRTGSRFSITGGVAPTELGRTMTLPTGTVYENLNCDTPEDARWKLAALAENERFNVTASATTQGDARVHQTWPVIIAGIGEAYEGLWFVRKVTHNISDPTYTMDLELGKDGRGSNILIPDARARRVVTTRPNPGGRPKSAYPPTVLVDGQWRAEWSAATRTFFEPSLRVAR